MRYFCQDESRWGLLTRSGRVITLKGVKPEGVYHWGRKTFWLYGLVEPLTGERYFDCFDTLNAEHFGQFIHQFSARYSDSVIVMQVDQAGAHLADELDWPENIIPICQPAFCPELNPIERLWQHLKSHIKWESFPNLKALRQRVQGLIDDLSDSLVHDQYSQANPAHPPDELRLGRVA